MFRPAIRVCSLALIVYGSVVLRPGSTVRAQCCAIYDCVEEDAGDTCVNDTGVDCSWDGAQNYCTYPSTGCRTSDSQYDNCCYTPHTPIVIDTDGSGFRLTDNAKGVFFAITSAPTFIRTAWTAADSTNAWLALDRNGDGQIDRGSELFGNFTPQPRPPFGKSANGFRALAVFDDPVNGGNGNGLIDPGDAVYARLRLWTDANHDGKSQASELFTLAQKGVYAIDLNYSTSQRKDPFGNAFRYRSRILRAPGAPDGRWAWDVSLAYDQNF